MFTKRKDKPKQLGLQTNLEKLNLSQKLNENVQLFQQVFKDDDTLIVRHFDNQQDEGVKCCALMVDGMVDMKLINESVIEPVVKSTVLKRHDCTIQDLESRVIISNSTQISADMNKLVKAIISGDTVLLLDGSAEGLIASTKEWKSRSITEPEAEKTIRGPREGFTEPLMINLSMIRRKLITPELKFKFMEFGVQSHTRVCICYLDNIVNHQILDELYRRLSKVNLDGIMASGYLVEFLSDNPYTPLKTVGSTERPDIVAAKLLEGRIAIVVDGTPVVLTIPHLFIEYFQANEDYYINFYFSSISRLIRIVGFGISVAIPAIYLALVTFQQELIPTELLLSISAARSGVPFPTIVEVVVQLLVFEIIREAGTRMPTNIGQALSIVGALVLGQAAVEARIVSAPIVIVVAISGITGLMIPRIKGVLIILRLFFVLFSAYMGLYGLVFAITGFLLHLCQLRSFGVPYLLPFTSNDLNDMKDTFIRMPWKTMKERPKFLARSNPIRQRKKGEEP